MQVVVVPYSLSCHPIETMEVIPATVFTQGGAIHKVLATVVFGKPGIVE